MRTTKTFAPGMCIVLALAACQPPAGAPAPAVQQTGNPTAPVAPEVQRPTSPVATSAQGKPAEHWQCGEVLLDAREDLGDITLRLSGRSIRLPQVESLAGARYADGDGNEFMQEQAGRAHLILAGDQARDCSPSTRASPWTEAAARGVEFRAVGSEPGWIVEVGQGDAPRLEATLDYGERKLEITSVTRAGTGYIGRTADGVTVVLTIQPTVCHDGMSGEAFEAGVQFDFGADTYTGCGALLDD